MHRHTGNQAFCAARRSILVGLQGGVSLGSRQYALELHTSTLSLDVMIVAMMLPTW
jgi:hypothetical protein